MGVKKNIASLVKAIMVLPLLLLLNLAVVAQGEDSVVVTYDEPLVIEKIDGVKYYIHTVKSKQTLYGIHLKYGVEINDIVLENPEIMDGLPVGYKLKIPYDKANKKKEVQQAAPMELDGKYILHTVEPQQTLYAIKTKYNIQVNDILKANPEITDGTIQIGQVLRIPVPQEEVERIGGTSEDIDSLAMIDAIFNEDDTAAVIKERYKVAFMLPLYIKENDSIEARRKPNEAMRLLSTVGVDFYEGALMALDSLKKLGLNVDVYVYDTRRDSGTVMKIIKDTTFKKLDLIIGPVFPEIFKLVASNAKSKTHLVSPLHTSSTVLKNRRNTSKPTSSAEAELDVAARYVARLPYKTRNILLVHTNAKDRELNTLFKQHLSVHISKDSAANKAAFKIQEIDFSDGKIYKLYEKMGPGDSNIVVFPSDDQAMATNLINKLYNDAKQSNYSIWMIGRQPWLKWMETIDARYLHTLRIHAGSSVYVDYNNPNVQAFVQSYYSKYHADPSRFAFRGYDVTYYYLGLLLHYGANFNTNLEGIGQEGLHTSFNYKRIGTNDGFENNHIYLLHYNDYELVRVP